MRTESMVKKTVLIAGMGNSPQVLTETVWELAHQKPQIVPDEIVVLAAQNSAEKLREKVLMGKESVWLSLLNALRKDKIDIDGKLIFGNASIRVVPDRDGNEMQDLRTGEDNLRAADFMLQQLRQYTETPDTVVIVSIAGGRKTMSALLFSCMTLLGREEDRVCHILMPTELEGGSDPVFYYPRKDIKHTSLRTGKIWYCRKVGDGILCLRSAA